MKKLLLLTAVFCSYSAVSQTNTLPSTGNCGIGTLQPDYKLTVNGNVRIDSAVVIKDSLVIEKTASISEDLKIDGQLILVNTIQDTTVAGNAFLVRGSNGQVKSIGIADISKFLYYKYCDVDASGNALLPTWSNGLNKLFTECPKVFVGIGTSSPSANLHIKVSPVIASNASIFLIENQNRKVFQVNNDGIVRSREVIVNLQNNWPDYVFEQQYPLMPLLEIENYIQENGHLPNVPAAKTVEESGIELGEMNRILLEKIEELTLHQIELKKEIEALKKAQTTK